MEVNTLTAFACPQQQQDVGAWPKRCTPAPEGWNFDLHQTYLDSPLL